MADLDLRDATAEPCDVDVPTDGRFAQVLGGHGLHPLLPIAVEWCAPLAWSSAFSNAWRDHGSQVVHAWHDLVLHRPLPERCRLEATVIGQRPTTAGALAVVRYKASQDGEAVWTTRAGILFRGLTSTAWGDVAPPTVSGSEAPGLPVEVGADLARRYSEASGIWNPIHTDQDAARAAGLDAPILHGSATLGLAVTELAGTGRVTRVAARFLAPVVPPDVLSLAITGQQAEVRRSDGTVVLKTRIEKEQS